MYHPGIKFYTVSGSYACSSGVKLNKSGNGAPLGKVVSGSLNSSKYGSSKADSGVGLAFGSYCNSLDTKSIASLGVLCLKTFSHGSGLI